jgi:spermidine synthase
MRPIPHRPTLRAAVPAALVLLLVALAVAIAAVLPETVFDRHGDFGRVRVSERGDGLRSLHVGAGCARQSAGYADRPLHLEFAYARVAAIAAANLPPDGRILYVGLGGGSMPRHTRHVRPDARIDAAEIDPLIADVAVRFFGVVPDHRLRIHVGDGRALVEDAPAGAWNVIVLDAFSDDEIPYALATRQFLEAVRAALTPDGIVVANLWTRNPDYRAMLATYGAVFDQVRLIPVPAAAQHVLLAGPAGAALDREALAAAARALDARAPLGFDLAGLVTSGYEAAAIPTSPVLEDR